MASGKAPPEDPKGFPPSHPLERPELPGTAEESCICAPPAAGIGWIPYYITLLTMRTRVGPNTYWTMGRQSNRHFLAFDELFDSGNPAPPGNFAGPAAFRQWTGGKEYRGAFYLDDLKLCIAADGSRILTWKYWDSVGYTPIRIKPAPNNKWTIFYSRGVKSAAYRAWWGPNWVQLRYWCKFKIGTLGNLGGWVLTGSLAPWAWMQMNYTIFHDTSVTIDFVGSFIPSQTYYVDWNRVGGRSIEGNTRNQITGFLNAGNCANSPGAVHHRFQGRGKVCK